MKSCVSSRTLRGVSAVVVMLASLAGCSDDGSGTDSTVPVSSSTTVSEVVEPGRVLLAGVILAAGDIEEAVADGIVTVDEADRAAEALENGTLGNWTESSD